MASPSINDVYDIVSQLPEFRGEILLPEDDDYDVVRSIWNGMIDRRPALIVRASGTADVVAAVNFARENDLDVAIHGGGHNVAGNAVSDGGLMIDLSELNGVYVDPEARTVRAQAEATLGDVDHETQLFGLATPLGVVTETGIAGLTLSGGYGHLAREHGLSVDNLTEVEIVTADGQVRTANEHQNEDLFWAVRGGGGNFGVVTSFEYDLHNVGPEVYQLFVWYHGDETTTRLAAFRDWAISAPRTVGVLAFTAHVPNSKRSPRRRGATQQSPSSGASVVTLTRPPTSSHLSPRESNRSPISVAPHATRTSRRRSTRTTPTDYGTTGSRSTLRN